MEMSLHSMEVVNRLTTVSIIPFELLRSAQTVTNQSEHSNQRKMLAKATFALVCISLFPVWETGHSFETRGFSSRTRNLLSLLRTEVKMQNSFLVATEERLVN